MPSGRMRDIDAAARSLHDPMLAESEIAGALEDAIVELGLAREAHYRPRVADSTRLGEGCLVVPVYRDRGPDGELRCTDADPCAGWPIRLLASHAAVALDARAHSWEARRREDALRAISEELQDALLPELPALPWTTMDVMYRAATAEARVGGDFYDVFNLPDGRALVVVGDVMGKGVQAASHTSRITHTLRALALQDLGLAELLARCDEQVTYQEPGLMATVWCGRYDPSTGELEFASLGHPPALLLRAEGDPISLALEGLPLGMRDLTGEAPEIRTRLLEPRDLLVLYTDGVVEASGDYLAGQKMLLAAMDRRRDEPLKDVLTGVLEEMLLSAENRDDAVMLLLRRR
jgi:serine phosphatase RsbU (regulator of sigma subunit)